jgi:hypothetical protein
MGTFFVTHVSPVFRFQKIMLQGQKAQLFAYGATVSILRPFFTRSVPISSNSLAKRTFENAHFCKSQRFENLSDYPISKCFNSRSSFLSMDLNRVFISESSPNNPTSANQSPHKNIMICQKDLTCHSFVDSALRPTNVN